MDVLEFVATLVRALVWPAVIALLLGLVFRKPMKELLASGLRKVRLGAFELEWQETEARTAIVVDAVPAAEGDGEEAGDESAPETRSKGDDSERASVSDGQRRRSKTERPVTEKWARVRRDAAARVERSPAQAVTHMFRTLELALRDVAPAATEMVSGRRAYSGRQSRILPVTMVLNAAVESGEISTSIAQAFDGLRQLRNLAAHDPESVTAEHAKGYLSLVDGVMSALAAEQAARGDGHRARAVREDTARSGGPGPPRQRRLDP